MIRSLREKCPYSEFFLSVFSRIRKTPNTDTSRSGYVSLNFSTIKIFATIFDDCGIYFCNLASEQKFLQTFKSVLIDMLFIASKNYKLCNIVLLAFTTHSLNYVQKPAENHNCNRNLTRSHFLESQKLYQQKRNLLSFHTPKN